MSDNKMVDAANKSDRAYFRVPVPRAEVVQLHCEKQSYRVLEFSEQGIRFESETAFSNGDCVRGMLVYGDQNSVNLFGVVLRSEPKQSGGFEIVSTVNNIQMQDIVAFQLYLVRRYGASESPQEAQKA